MPVYKNKDNGTWYVMTQYTDWKGERKPKCKRGFATKREAQDWEQKFQQQSSGDLDMPFSAFVEMILSILVDTFSSRISLTMPPSPKPHNTACVLS